jgi:hypothetical protein
MLCICVKAQSVRVAVILFGVKPDGKKYFIYFHYDAFHATSRTFTTDIFLEVMSE